MRLCENEYDIGCYGQITVGGEKVYFKFKGHHSINLTKTSWNDLDTALYPRGSIVG